MPNAKILYGIIILVAVVSSVSLFLLYSIPTDDSSTDVTPVYVSIVVHNEEPSNSTTYQDYTANKTYYLEHREMIRRFALMLHSYNIAFNFQSDWAFLKACQMYDNDSVCINTDGKNIIRYLKENLGVSIDPHAHETLYNYADVAYLIKQLGVEPSNVVGGFIAEPPEDSVFDHFTSPIEGWHYDFTWVPEILWGASTYLHQSDTVASGVWKPKDRYHFYQHDEEQNLIYVANYDKSFNGVLELVSALENKEIPDDRIYTATIFVSQQLISEDFIVAFEDVVKQLKQLEYEGKVVLTTIQGAVDAWRNIYKCEPNIYIKNTKTPNVLTNEYDENANYIDITLPSEVAGEDGLVVRIIYPKDGKERYSNGKSPVVVFVPGANSLGSINAGAAQGSRLMTGFGMTYVYFNFPGGGTPPLKSGGEYDSRGIKCIKALRDVILFALNKKPEKNGYFLSELVPCADVSNVGVVGWSNGGNIVAVTFDLYGNILEGVSYYVGYENPAGDEYILVDLGGGNKPNPAYIPGKTYLDPVKGSVSELDEKHLKYDSASKRMYFDFNENDIYDPEIDYECGCWDYNGKRYFSTEIIELAIGKGIDFSQDGIANLSEANEFWLLRDMSRHFENAKTHLKTLKGAIIFSSKRDHVQFTPDYPHTYVNYIGWSGLKFVRLNPDAAYVRYAFSMIGVNVTGIDFADNDANMSVNLSTMPSLMEPEIGCKNEDAIYVTAAVAEMADRVHYNMWEKNLDHVIVS